MCSDALLPKLPERGAIFADKYEILGVLGRGGMGVVFDALHVRIQRRVAVKVLYPHIANEPETLARFEREARAAGQLRSPHVARVIDVETKVDLPYIVLEFLEGHDLEEELEVKGRLPVTDALDYVLQACAAMHEAHSLGIVHRDLKPANLFLVETPDGPMIKVLDFGISKIMTETDGKLTAAMTTMGSPIYMSPEQLREARDVDTRTDIWGLGVILFELLTGAPPFTGSVTQVTAAIVTDKTPELRSLRDDIPPELEAAVRRALEKDPAKRFQDAESFADALAPFASPNAARRFYSSLSLPISSGRVSSGRLSKRPADTDALTQMTPNETYKTFASPLARSRPRWQSALLIATGITIVIAIAAFVVVRRSVSRVAAAASVAPSAEPAEPVTIAPIAIPEAKSEAKPAPSASPSSAPPDRTSHARPPAVAKNPLHL